MEIIFVLLPISLLLAVVAYIAYWWNVKNGQYDDLETPAMRMLFEDEKVIDQKREKVSEKSS